jgi:hypothetical protein
VGDVNVSFLISDVCSIARGGTIFIANIAFVLALIVLSPADAGSTVFIEDIANIYKFLNLLSL